MHLGPRNLLLLAILAGCAGQPAQGEVVIGAAASLSAILPELTAAFETETGIAVTATIGSTGQLAQQIRQGAPIAVFLAADVATVDALAEEGLVVPATRAIYARGRLAMWTRDTSGMHLTRVEDVARGSVQRIAIANPSIAPYGRAAREALERAGIWEAVQPRLAIAENVRQALQYAETGNAEVAFVAHSQVRDVGGHTVFVPDSLHAPLDQALGVVATQDSARAARFASFVLGPSGRSILEQHGFRLPEAR
jgi:molybdate transport system substrate-binding protein